MAGPQSDARHPQDNTSQDIQLRAKVRFSNAPDRGMVTATLSPHYLADDPPTPEWHRKVDDIRTAHPTDAERATAALRLVQDDIRYVWLSDGARGGYSRACRNR